MSLKSLGHFYCRRNENNYIEDALPGLGWAGATDFLNMGGILSDTDFGFILDDWKLKLRPFSTI